MIIEEYTKKGKRSIDILKPSKVVNQESTYTYLVRWVTSFSENFRKMKNTWGVCRLSVDCPIPVIIL